MSLESAVKYGRIASILNIIMPVFGVLTFTLLFFQRLTLITEEISNFSAGIFTGLSIGISVVSVIAFILFILSMYRLSKYYKEPSIFRNILFSFILTIVLTIIIGITIIGFIVLIGTQITVNSLTETAIMQTAISAIMLILLILCIGIIFAIINGVLYWKAFTKLGEKTNVDAFKTAGLLYLLGSILQIVGIGAILCWISWIYTAKGFKQIQPISNTVNYTSDSYNKIYCSYCGKENNINTPGNYCVHCGKLLHINQ